MNKKDLEMREQAREAIIEALKDGYDGYYSDLHNELFNTDYYIIGTCEAREALEEYGVFDAIEKVQEYEKDNFGGVYTDLSDPEELVNMLYYIISEEVLYEMMEGIELWNDNWNNIATDETNAEILKQLEEE
jgi:GDP-D-mannose dehydratase